MQREFLIFLITIGALCSVTVSGEGQTPAANKTAGTQEPEPNKKQDTDNTETGQTAFTRALAGTDISGASSADSQQGYFIDFDLTAPLKKCDPSEPENCRFWGWVNPRILSLTAPGSSAGDAGVLTPLTNAFTTTSSASNLTKLVAGFEFLAGADVMLKNGQGFPKILPNTIVSIEWTVSAGTSTPFSAANAAQIFTVNNAIRLKFPAVTTGCPDSTATTPAAPACQYIAFIPPNRDRFFRQYFTGLRFKSFYRQNENGAKDKHGESFPGTLDVTAGQSELVTGGILRGLILKIEGFYPLPFPKTQGIFVYGTVLTRLKEATTSIPLIAQPAPNDGTVTLTSPSVLPQVIRPLDRDSFRIGIAFDLGRIISKIGSESTPAINGGSSQGNPSH